MIRIQQLKLPEEHTQEDIRQKAARLLGIRPEELRRVVVRKRSLDARKKPKLYFNYVLDIEAGDEKRILRRNKSPQILLWSEPSYHFPRPGRERLPDRPLVIGAGPAGLFCGLMLARNGYCPLLLERGEDVDARWESVRRFWAGGPLNERSNVQFGEGGAGTFSDGKLNTLVKDPFGRNRLVLETFRSFGADPSILIDHKPHIGTDGLSRIIKGIRGEILRLGGEVRFSCQVTGLYIEGRKLSGVLTERGERIPAQAAVLAIGHSARDTFRMLEELQVPMAPKPFAVGLRIEHPQAMINESQYGRKDAGALGAADYKLTGKTANGGSIYSFCMCPGGYVVNASSERGCLAVNGMSFHDRAGQNANSALVVPVGSGDFEGTGPLSGLAFQRKLERAACLAAAGKIPIQLYGDFCKNRTSEALGAVMPQTCGEWGFSNLRSFLPERISLALMEGMADFGRKIQGFDRADAVLSGIESRTSSPVRILRGENFQSEISGLYPCGEGAGYAGGITSAAIDGIKAAEMIAGRYQRP